MKRQKKKYSRPRKPFDKARIDDENILPGETAEVLFLFL